MISISEPRGDDGNELITLSVAVINRPQLSEEQMQEYKNYLETCLKTTMSSRDFIEMTTGQCV